MANAEGSGIAGVALPVDPPESDGVNREGSVTPSGRFDAPASFKTITDTGDSEGVESVICDAFTTVRTGA